MNLRLLWLASLAFVLLGLSRAPLVEKYGCQMDPNGCKPPTQGGSASDAGGYIDPNGN